MSEPTEREIERGRICRKPGLGRTSAQLPPEEPVSDRIGIDEIVERAGITIGKVREALTRAGIQPLVLGRPRHPAEYDRAKVLAWVAGRTPRRKIEAGAVRGALTPKRPRAEFDDHVGDALFDDGIRPGTFTSVDPSAIVAATRDCEAMLTGRPRKPIASNAITVLDALRLKLDLAEARKRDAEEEAAKWRAAIEAVEEASV